MRKQISNIFLLENIFEYPEFENKFIKINDKNKKFV